jgi:glycosyltransferase involved in cell wall biosynthesis
MRILVAGQSGSIHVTRFVVLLQQLGHHVRVFVCDRWYWQEEHLRNTTVYIAYPHSGHPPQNGNRLVVTYPRETAMPAELAEFERLAWEAQKAEATNTARPRTLDLVCVLEEYRPHVVISCKMQDEGYAVSEAKDRMGADFPCPWIHFCWGTDLEFFGKDPTSAPEHRPRIERALGQCDYLFADTMRDLRQAPGFGFRGKPLGAFLAHGGFDLEALAPLRTNAPKDRDIILVKGRQGGHVGRAMNVMQALEGIADRLRDYRVMLMMATPDVAAFAEGQGKAAGIRYEVLGRLPYADLLNLYARARLAISATTVDGTPSFLAEAMVMGALPVHSDMESVREWVDDGVNGLLFPVDDIAMLQACIERGLDDEELCRTAADRNLAIAQARMSRRAIGESVRRCLKAPTRSLSRLSFVARRLRNRTLAGTRKSLARISGLRRPT